MHAGVSAHPQTPHALSTSGSLLFKSLGPFGDSDNNGSRYRLHFLQTPLGGSFCDKHENTPLPVDHLVVWKVVFLVMALLASNPPTSLSPINTVSVQTLCNLPVFQQNLYFVLVCFALCVCMVQRDCCYHIYSKQQGCKLVFVTN